MDDQQERLIAQGLRDGKSEAWQALYDAYAERVWRSVARLLGAHAADVADVVQETMLAAARSARAFDPARGSLWAWLSGIAHNHAVLHLRKQAQRQRLVESAALRAGGNGQPIDVLEEAELVERVRAALANLLADHALVLTARYLDGESVSSIALRERTTEVAIRSRLARARQAFRIALGDFTGLDAPSAEKLSPGGRG
ncbi:MAG: sigma-70 family RNA polymerase sigma factor [Planctomycetes bacterium]|nr:sigma-70 family RNA polymerase sigma factor [Planctomycetota bacterium]